VSNRRWTAVAAVVALCVAGLVAVMLRAPDSVTVPVDALAGLIAPMLAAAACAVAGRRHRGRVRVGWYLVGASAATWGAGQGVWTVYDLVIHQNPFPSAADAGFLASVPILLVGLLTMPVWPASRAARLRAITDGLLIAGGLLLVSWNTVLAAIVASPADTALGQGLSLAYPVCDVIVVTVLAIMWSRATAGARAPLLMMIGGLTLIAVSDSTFAYQQAQNSFVSGNVINMGWVAGYLAVGLGALLSLNRPLRPTVAAVPSWSALILPYAPVPLVVGFAVQDRVIQGKISIFTLVMALAVFVIVLVRQGLSVRDNIRLLRRLARNETELHHRAEHDPLTDLLNRSSFIRSVEELLAASAPGRLCAVMFVDLDDFKHINDSLGHTFGDQAIVGVGRRLRSCTRDGDLVARLGGDEFAIFLRGLPNVSRLVSVAERIIDALNDPFESSDMRASVCGTIGVAIAEAGDDASELLRRADIAMYAAKAQGKGLFGIFEPSMHVAMYAPLERRADLERAVEAGELTLHFQPIVHVPTRAILGVEALIRWEHPRLGLLGPPDFIEDIESAGLMVGIGTWVVREACRQVLQLHAATGQHDLVASVNVSSSQLHDPGFVAMIARALAETGLPPTCLVIELTESGSIGDSEVVADRLRVLRQMGVRIAIDDFGSGYSSFMYLRRLRVDALKIDKSFIDDLLAGGPSTALVEGMLRLGGSLGLDTIAEGVESEEQHAALLRLDCRVAQGYLYARPALMDQLIARYGRLALEEAEVAAVG
jgi:diguanylate cyclase (GGDEF)-like protein